MCPYYILSKYFLDVLEVVSQVKQNSTCIRNQFHRTVTTVIKSIHFSERYGAVNRYTKGCSTNSLELIPHLGFTNNSSIFWISSGEWPSANKVWIRSNKCLWSVSVLTILTPGGIGCRISSVAVCIHTWSRSATTCVSLVPPLDTMVCKALLVCSSLRQQMRDRLPSPCG